MAGVDSCTQMGMFMRANGLTTRRKEGGHMSILMGLNTSESGKTTVSTDMESKHGLMKRGMRAIINMARKMVSEPLNGLMAVHL